MFGGIHKLARKAREPLDRAILQRAGYLMPKPLSEQQRALYATRGGVHFDKSLLSALIPTEAGEAIATRYDTQTDTYHIATTSGQVVKLPRVSVEKAKAREYDIPESRLFDGAGNKIEVENKYGIQDRIEKRLSEQIMKQAQDMGEAARSSIEQQIRDFEEQYQKHAKNRDSLPQGQMGEPGHAKQAQPKPKTFDEAWEMAEGRLAERQFAPGRDGAPFGCSNYLIGDPCPADAEVQMQMRQDGVYLCSVCAYAAIEKHGIGILDSADE